MTIVDNITGKTYIFDHEYIFEAQEERNSKIYIYAILHYFQTRNEMEKTAMNNYISSCCYPCRFLDYSMDS